MCGARSRRFYVVKGSVGISRRRREKWRASARLTQRRAPPRALADGTHQHHQALSRCSQTLLRCGSSTDCVAISDPISAELDRSSRVFGERPHARVALARRSPRGGERGRLWRPPWGTSRLSDARWRSSALDIPSSAVDEDHLAVMTQEATRAVMARYTFVSFPAPLDTLPGDGSAMQKPANPDFAVAGAGQSMSRVRSGRAPPRSVRCWEGTGYLRLPLPRGSRSREGGAPFGPT
jgi:hypothetical protein